MIKTVINFVVFHALSHFLVIAYHLWHRPYESQKPGIRSIQVGLLRRIPKLEHCLLLTTFETQGIIASFYSYDISSYQ